MITIYFEINSANKIKTLAASAAGEARERWEHRKSINSRQCLSINETVHSINMFLLTHYYSNFNVTEREEERRDGRAFFTVFCLSFVALFSPLCDLNEKLNTRRNHNINSCVAYAAPIFSPPAPRSLCRNRGNVPLAPFPCSPPSLLRVSSRFVQSN